MGRLDGKIALITGGTSGIGLATAQLFEREGAQVIINAHSEEVVAEGLGQLSNKAVGIRADAGSVEDIVRMMSQIKGQFGALDIIVMCAGVMNTSALEEATEAEFDLTFAVNVKGAYFTVQKAEDLLRRGGSIILVSSGTVGMGRVGRTLYAASKAAVRSLARSLAAELAHIGVRVNAVSPGPIMTPMNMVPERTWSEQEAYLGSLVPIGRVGKPIDIANAMLFLASSESSFVLGADFAVDGGWAQLHAIPPKKTARVEQ
jgi:NAD(P)-dependent dehydrogenase (short-subunit alcohol dehydrogenase family)